MGHLKNLLVWLGAFLVVVMVLPPRWYAQWMAQPWTESTAPVLIVLGGDSIRDGMMGESSYWRCVSTVDLWREGHLRRILLSGDAQTTASMRAWIVGQGIPAGAVTVEDRSQSTRENALFSAAVLRNIPGPYALLTGDIHTWRAYRVFRKAGVVTLPRPAPDALKRANDWRNRPRVFLDVVAEWGKIAYYAFRGWI